MQNCVTVVYLCTVLRRTISMDTILPPKYLGKGPGLLPPRSQTSDQRPFKSQKEEKDVQWKLSGDLPSSSVKIVALWESPVLIFSAQFHLDLATFHQIVIS